MSGQKNQKLRKLYSLLISLALVIPMIGSGRLSAEPVSTERDETEVESYLAAVRLEAETEFSNFPVGEATPAEIIKNRAIDQDLAKQAATKRALVEFVRTHDDSLLSLKNIPNAQQNTPQISRGNSSAYRSATGPGAASALTSNSKINPLKADETSACNGRSFVENITKSRREFYAKNTGYHSLRQGYL